jgi:chaperone required for assembly of F1-ATPase
MRDLLSDLETGKAADDAIKSAQVSMRPAQPKRFYKLAQVAEINGTYAVQLDGRTAKTPARKPIVLPSLALADAIAREFAAQGDLIDAMSMPVMRICNAAIEGVADNMDAVRADVCAYAGSDLLCYRAAEPEKLVVRQSAVWDPLVRTAEGLAGARFVLVEGVMHQPQPAAGLHGFAAALARHAPDAFTLAAVHVMTSLTGSALLALCVGAGLVEGGRAWEAAHLDEDWTNENWGVDAEAAARRTTRFREFDAACRITAMIAADA